MTDYTIYRLNTDATKEAVGTMHGAPEDKTSYAFAVVFCQWVTTFERGRIVENCGYEAEPVTTIEELDPLPPEEWECNRYRAGVVGGGLYGANKVR